MKKVICIIILSLFGLTTYAGMFAANANDHKHKTHPILKWKLIKHHHCKDPGACGHGEAH